jgi:choline dehydrogenase-like flavoprotein
MTNERADVLVIGAGPSGAVAAKRLAEAGMKVVCLEQGEWPDRTRFPGDKIDYELTTLKQWSLDPNVRGLPQDYPIDLTESDLLGIGNFNAVGGSATLYGGIWPRMTPSNFRSRSLHGYGEDWPLSYEELRPFYERTDREFGVSGLDGNPAYPPGEGPPLPPLPISKGGLRLARGHARLGWHWWPDNNAIPSIPYQGRRPCVQRGSCYSGCNEGAKASPDLTHWQHLVKQGVRLIAGARVRRLVIDKNGLAAGAEWYDHKGVGHIQEADLVICAANAIGTPRLLLASADERHPDGLANNSGLLGRNLMLHTWALVTGIFDEPLESWRGHRSSVGCMQFYESDESRNFVGTSKWHLEPGTGPLTQALPMPGLGVWGANHHAHVAERLGRTLVWGITGDDLPSEANRVVLSDSLQDSSGFAAPKLIYRVNDNTKRMFEWQVERARESFEAAGAAKVEAMPLIPVGTHLYGTARMGDDPGKSVVNRWGISHDIRNLAIVDGSVFVTTGGVNPTSTVTALAARTADYLVAHRAQVPRPERHSSFALTPPGSAQGFGQSDAGGIDETQATFEPAEREQLAALADVLIPPDQGKPAPSEVGIGENLLDLFAAARPDLVAALRRALQPGSGDVVARLRELAEKDAEAQDALEVAVAGGYYMSAEVRALIGYPGDEPVPVQPDRYPPYFEEGLLDHLLNEQV